MYENVKKPPKPKSGAPLFVWLTVCLVIFGLVVGIFVWAWQYQTGYRTFLSAFSSSTYYAYNNDSMTVTKDGLTYKILPENIYPIYAAITSRGSGRVGKPPKTEPAAVLRFGDGTYMELWSAEPVEGQGASTFGMFVNYVNRDGDAYSYDHDRLRLSLLPIEVRENVADRLKG